MVAAFGGVVRIAGGRADLRNRSDATTGETSVLVLSALCVVVGFLSLVAIGRAAEIEREISIKVSGSERVERVRTTIRPGVDEDPMDASSVVILLDYDRELVEAAGWCVAPNGKRQKVKRRDRDVVDWPGESLYDSATFLVLSCPEAQAGGHIEATWEVKGSPVFPGGRLALSPSTGDVLKHLSVSLEGADLRWHLSGTNLGMTETAIPGGVRFEGRDLEVEDDVLELAGAMDLFYAWGPTTSWEGVADWYRGLLNGLPRAAPSVQAAARQAASDLAPDAALEAIANLVQRDVRYVAVQIGVGGWLPSTPEEVWERRWGDCKDKTMLLIDLLKAAGIEARPALALLGGDRRVDPAFPTPFQFNHLVAAVRLDSLESPPDTAPIVGDWLILDGTQRRGGGGWLNPSVQGQKLLLVGEKGGELIDAPLTPQAEKLRIDVILAEDRRGSLILEFVGSRASLLIEELEVTPANMAVDIARRMANQILGPVVLENLEWRRSLLPGAPNVKLVAQLSYPDSLPLAPPEVRWLPEPRELEREDFTLPIATRLGTLDVHWSGPLEPGCVTDTRNDASTQSIVGEVRQQTSSPEPGRVDVNRRTEIDIRWVDDDETFDGLRELSLAEHRILRRQLRLLCSTEGG
ncbi:MAG: transglutaminase family protein [Thermoanaerobaculia bacterium]|nr:transglutaminase family protein [Thermoanaerobaculia bacterium]